MENQSKSIGNHVFIFLAFFMLVLVIISFFNTWFLVGLLLLGVIGFAKGYGAAVSGGIIAGAIFWFLGFVSSLINAITHPFGLFVLRIAGVA